MVRHHQREVCSSSTTCMEDEMNNMSKPAWLQGLMGETFFGGCGVHENRRKNEKNVFCLHCCLSICPHCLHSHRSHPLLQVLLSVLNSSPSTSILENCLIPFSIHTNLRPKFQSFFHLLLFLVSTFNFLVCIWKICFWNFPVSTFSGYSPQFFCNSIVEFSVNCCAAMQLWLEFLFQLFLTFVFFGRKKFWVSLVL